MVSDSDYDSAAAGMNWKNNISRASTPPFKAIPAVKGRDRYRFVTATPVAHGHR